jgi:outer membrane protein insertion porin family
MDGRVAKAVVSLLVLAFLTTAPCRQAPAMAAGDAITVAGNRHIDAQMIRSHFHADADGRFDANALDAALKSLYATGLFSDVKISRQGDQLLVTVVENPNIGRIAFEGNKKIKDDELKKDLQSKAGGPLWRAFVHDDVEHIIELYRQHGYFSVHVDPKTINGKNGRLDLVFEIKEGDKLAVRQVLFTGNNAFPANKLKGAIKTGETNLLSFLLNNDTYDADRIENDRDLIRRYYLARGFADVQVHAASSYETDKKGVVVTFTIDEGPLYRLGTVDIQSRLRAVDPAVVQPYLHTQSGDVYNADAVQKTVEDGAIGLARAGQPFATVLSRSERVPRGRLINLVYTIDAGKRMYIERIEIHGNSKTRDDVIRREFDFVEGDAYNRALIDRSERRLKQLGYFKTVKISSQQGSAPDRIIVDVTVEEDRTGTFSISGGYSNVGGVMAEVSIGDRNFLGTGDVFKASVTYGEYVRGFDLSFTDPYALGPHVSLGGELFYRQNSASPYQSYDSTVYGAKLVAGAPITDQLGVQWNYSIYNQGLSLDPSEGTASLPIRQAAAAGPMWVSSIGTGVAYSTLDNPRDPTNGVRVQTNSDFAGLGGAAKFARTTEDVRYYHQIVGDLVGVVHAQAGYVTPWGGQQLPLLDGFFGGPQLVRGFAPNGFGPRDITPGTTMDNLGGNVYWATSAELQAPVPFVPADAQLKMALFSDVGSLWATGGSTVTSLASSLSPSQQIANSQAPRASVGASLIWDSPMGPLRLDYAFPIAKQPYDVTQALNFTAGRF